jgi:predicted trehalose synthase
MPPEPTCQAHPDLGADAASAARAWSRRCQDQFLAGYREALPDLPDHPEVLDALVLDKALYEVVYEARNRPTLVGDPAHRGPGVARGRVSGRHTLGVR